jgi:hypothetical protein
VITDCCASQASLDASFELMICLHGQTFRGRPQRPCLVRIAHAEAIDPPCRYYYLVHPPSQNFQLFKSSIFLLTSISILFNSSTSLAPAIGADFSSASLPMKKVARVAVTYPNNACPNSESLNARIRRLAVAGQKSLPALFTRIAVHHNASPQLNDRLN